MINIVLYEPEIPQNTGNIMRTCAGTYAKLHLIKPLGFSLNEKAIRRSGVNYIEHCDYKIYEDWADFINQNEGRYYFLTRYGQKTHTDVDYSNIEDNIYLIFGKESTGIPKEILKNHLDDCLRIPTNDNIRALNLSNCVALMLFEVLRQQDYPNLLKTEPFKGENYLID
jgi:Predicted rRNA methylase (SpoU class)